jgi:hypothetical protein
MAVFQESGARGRTRTTDTRIFNPLLYQLSYPGIFAAANGAALTIGREPDSNLYFQITAALHA